MTTRISINGQICDSESATISVLDRGFLYGDSVYEVMRTYAGNLFAIDEHLERLNRSASLLDIPLPIGLSALTEEILTTLQAANNDESYLRCIITRGSGPIGLDPALATNPQCVIIVKPLDSLPDALYEQGAKACLVTAGFRVGGAVPAGAKSGNYLTNLMALRTARQKGAHEAFMLDADGRVTEGSTSNVFAVIDDRLVTPALHVGLLEGITRRKVLQLARSLSINVAEIELTGNDLMRASEVFLTSTLREVLPVTSIDDTAVGQGVPGPTTKSLMQAFFDLTRKNLP